jgi:hypothetical protein
MTPALADGLLQVMAVYFGVGAVFALVFVCFAVQRLDPAARGMPLAARLLILPGAAALWPLLAWKWLRRQPPPLA